jgi:DNA-directed RNA polymerase specialized sigma24 family protein
MSELSTQKIEQKKDRILTPKSFQRLLNWLDEGTDSDGQKYLEMRQRLVAYFDRKNCSVPDELADETLSRVARRLEEVDATEGDAPAKYCYIVARFVFMEYLRAEQKNNSLLDNLRQHPQGENFAVTDHDNEKEIKEKMLNCLEQCTARLETLNRETIIRYYTGKERIRIENRRALAKSLGITMNALSIRSCRIRNKLEACVRQCISAE